MVPISLHTHTSPRTERPTPPLRPANVDLEVLNASITQQLYAIEKSLIQAYAGSAILLDDLNARVVLGQEIDVGTHAQMTSALVRIPSRLGLQRRHHAVTPTVEEYLRSKRQELPS
jgi:hypothetical protein